MACSCGEASSREQPPPIELPSERLEKSSTTLPTTSPATNTATNAATNTDERPSTQPACLPAWREPVLPSRERTPALALSEAEAHGEQRGIPVQLEG